MSDSLWSQKLQHARPPCPSPTPGVHPNLCPSSRWCHRTISSPVVPFSSCPQSLPASGSFPMSQLFAWGGQSIGVSAFNISPSSEHPGMISFRMDWLGLLAVQGTLKSLLQHHSSKASSALSFLYSPTLTSIHDHWKNVVERPYHLPNHYFSLMISDLNWLLKTSLQIIIRILGQSKLWTK